MIDFLGEQNRIQSITKLIFFTKKEVCLKIANFTNSSTRKNSIHSWG